ncbi:MAG TPA: SIMPL domain-containing protein [Treponemataceae bacterium]|nr:SIMPL domain-containing protein [Treponemataceae bacterium]
MNKKILLVSTLLLVFFSTAFAAGASEKTENLISVTGTGVITIEPDTASISLAVVTYDEEASVSAQKNAELMTKVIEAVKAIEINDDDIATTNYNMYQESKYDREGAITSKLYRVTNNLDITVHKIDSAGDVIDAALLAGANKLSSITFYAKDTKKAYTAARTLAVQQATDTAKTLAKAAGCTLGKVRSISEQHNANVYRSDMMYMKNAVVAESAVASTPVSPGSTDITVNVNMSFTIK